jgi:arylsulfatase A-like enzyme
MLRAMVPSIRKCAAAVTALDTHIEVIVTKLDRMGIRTNTLIIFTSASGFLLGRHGLWSDGLASDPINMYDEVMATPLIWSWPSRVPVEAMRPELVSSYDLVPSLCELTGATLPAGRTLPGRSYLPAVFNEPFPKKNRWRNTVFGEYRDIAMVRDQRYKLVLRNGGKGPNELYAVRADPREKMNQYDNPSFITVRDQLAAELAAWRKASA